MRLAKDVVRGCKSLQEVEGSGNRGNPMQVNSEDGAGSRAGWKMGWSPPFNAKAQRRKGATPRGISRVLAPVFMGRAIKKYSDLLRRDRHRLFVWSIEFHSQFSVTAGPCPTQPSIL